MKSRKALRELCEKASPPPWRLGWRNRPGVLVDRDGTYIDELPICPDAEFIAASREAVPALLDQVEKLEKALREIKNMPIQSGSCLDLEMQIISKEALKSLPED